MSKVRNLKLEIRIKMSEPVKSHLERLEAMLESADSGAVHALAIELRDAGLSHSELYAVFDAARIRHEHDADERKYDVVLDIMDLITGWCAPGNALNPQTEVPVHA